MWLLFTFGHVVASALVMYIDEYLNSNSKVPEASSIHKKIGGLFLASTIFSFIGATGIYLFAGTEILESGIVWLAVASSVPAAFMYMVYFYMLNLNPVNQVAPLFQVGTIWILLFEVLRGAEVTIFGLLGIALLILGAYVLDAGGFVWRTPTKLLFGMAGGMFVWAISVILIQQAALESTPLTASFYQLLGIGTIGLVLYIVIKPFRTGLHYRIQTQGKNFLGFSALNEITWQFAMIFAVLAIAAAPLAAYYNAAAGTASLVLLGLLALFPVSGRNRVTWVQVFAVCCMALGIFFIEFWR